MADRVYPSAKPTASGGGENVAFPPAKVLPPNATRPFYRPQLLRHRNRRSCCCRCCLWITFTIFLIVILAALSGVLVWFVYRPHTPHFSVSSFQVSELNIKSSKLISKFNLTLIAQNPNKKIVFFYDPTAISITSDGVDIGDGTLPAFTQATRNTTALRTVIGGSAARSIDDASAILLKSKLKNSGNLAVKIQLDTKVKVKMGALKTKKVAIRVSCDGINAAVPVGKAAKTATVANVKCKVDLRIKIWKWTL
ncbi:NDR1/HIN1-like protein 13 [Impatiens glandulifera]|uniref:NDR1/HIN1-like protein 13 n=1 Tax=Impatiens glandulifera TaxID=253017 RepID=UPI001FB0FA0B|nr:NDR1/HIN1-like protein 13 [Impatiens glandulifera]